MKRILDHPGFLWAILALPSVLFVVRLLGGEPGPDGQPVTELLLHPTGEFSARLMIIALMLTPLRMLFPASGFLRWMKQRRRSFGVAAFGYAALHVMLYVLDMQTLSAILGDAVHIGIWSGWVGFVIFLPLAITSNDYCVRWLGRAWTRLQRWVHVGAVAVLVHWIFVHNQLGPALVHFLPLALLQLFRLYKIQNRRAAA